MYYALKKRQGYDLPDKNAFISEVSDIVSKHIASSGYDYVICPESSTDFLNVILSQCNVQVHWVPKNTKDDIVSKIDTLKLQKREKQSHLEHIAEMDETFKMRGLKLNQRKKYYQYLFKNKHLDLKGKGVIVDDSCFSGTTFKALEFLYGKHDLLAIFAK